MGASNRKPKKRTPIFPPDEVRPVTRTQTIEELLAEIKRLDKMVEEPSRSADSFVQSRNSFGIEDHQLDVKDLDMCDLINILSIQNESTQLALTEISNRLRKYDIDDLRSFWDQHSDLLIVRNRSNPSNVINLGLDRIPYGERLTYLRKLGITIFASNQEEALYLLNGDVNIAYNLLKKESINMANLLISDKFSQQKIKRRAFEARSKHAYGFSHMLFLKAYDQKGANDIIELFAPPYIKILMQC